MHDARERTGVPGVAAGFSHDGESAVRGRRRARARRAGAGAAGDAVPDRVDLEAVHGDARCARAGRARRRSSARCSATPPGFAASRRSRCRRRRTGSGRTRTPATGRPATRAAAACGSPFDGRDARRRSSSRSGSRATGYDEPAAPRARPRAGGRDRTARRARRRVPGRAPAVGRPLVDRRAISCASARTTSTRSRAARAACASALGAALRARLVGARASADAPRSTTRGRSAATSRCSCSCRRSGSCSRCSRTAGAAAALDPPHRRGARSRCPRPPRRSRSPDRVAGVYALDGVEATIAVDERRAARDRGGDGSGHRRADRTALSGARRSAAASTASRTACCRATGSTFRAPDVARVGWLALPRVSP